MPRNEKMPRTMTVQRALTTDFVAYHMSHDDPLECRNCFIARLAVEACDETEKFPLRPDDIVMVYTQEGLEAYFIEMYEGKVCREPWVCANGVEGYGFADQEYLTALGKACHRVCVTRFQKPARKKG